MDEHIRRRLLGLDRDAIAQDEAQLVITGQLLERCDSLLREGNKLSLKAKDLLAIATTQKMSQDLLERLRANQKGRILAPYNQKSFDSAPEEGDDSDSRLG